MIRATLWANSELGADETVAVENVVDGDAQEGSESMPSDGIAPTSGSIAEVFLEVLNCR